MALSREEVEKIATLSRLEFSNEEIEKFQNQLNNILSYVELLNEVDTEGVEPLSQAFEMKNEVRKDEVKPSIDNSLAVKNAPEEEDGAFVVPKIVG